MAIKYKYPLFFILLLLGLLGYTAKNNAPIPTGDAEDYWEFSCGVELKKFDGYFPYARWTGIFPDNEGWYFYYFQEHHGRHVFKVSKESLLAQVDEVFTLLGTEIIDTVQKKTRDNVMEIKNQRRKNCLNLMDSVSSNKDRFIDEVSSQSYSSPNMAYELESFQYQWERGKLYWLTILFEAVFLSFWWLFSFHKGFFGKFNSKVSTRLAFSPLILFLPHFLGYAPYLFTFGPSGGILYPIFAIFMGLPFGWIPFNPIEIELLKFLPQPLYYISQVPASPMAVSFSGSISPTVLSVYAILVLIASKLVSWYRASKKS